MVNLRKPTLGKHLKTEHFPTDFQAVIFRLNNSDFDENKSNYYKLSFKNNKIILKSPVTALPLVPPNTIYTIINAALTSNDSV